MTKKEPKNYRISTGKRKVSPATGTVLEEDWLTVEAETKKECEDMYDKLSDGDKNGR